jgi:hypothetical protein
MAISNPYGQGQRAQLDAETAVAKALWGIEQDKAQIGHHNAQAAKIGTEDAILRARPDIVAELALLEAQNNGFTGGMDALNEARGRMKQGLPAVVFDNGQQTAIDPQAQTAVSRALIGQLPNLGVEHWNPENMADARAKNGAQFRLEDVQGGRVPLDQYQAEQFAKGGHARYGVQGNTVVDQLRGVQGPTAVGQSMIGENNAQAGAANARAQGADKFQLIPMPDADGNMTLQRVPVKGDAGTVPLPEGVRPAPKRDPNDLQNNAEYRAAYPMGAGPNDPSQQEWVGMRKAGYDPAVDFKRLVKEANDAIKKGAAADAVRDRLKSFGINPNRIK